MPRAGVDERDAVERDAALVRPDQPGDDVDERGLAGARPAEQRDEPAAGLEAGIEQELAQAMLDVDCQRHSTSRRRLAQRAISSEASKASMEIATDTRVRRSAPASPPGTCVKV